MTMYALGEVEPATPADGDFWVAPDANVIGNCTVKAGASVWFGSTLRGDNELIEIGAGSNIQENCVLHTDPGFELLVGENCTIGHKAMLHGCIIGDGTLIGMGATLLNGAERAGAARFACLCAALSGPNAGISRSTAGYVTPIDSVVSECSTIARRFMSAKQCAVRAN